MKSEVLYHEHPSKNCTYRVTWLRDWEGIMCYTVEIRLKHEMFAKDIKIGQLFNIMSCDEIPSVEAFNEHIIPSLIRGFFDRETGKWMGDLSG